ncbi:mycothiol transferase [Corynebacterium comes]|uniref:DinB superfamily protein n=1 Tax=Corynebacterium comes TaxID=2675218 RepID=A0A6B8VJH4_9CORY|nr:DinB family protein [Corynebacterium comes]QGU05512.1 DinB superfamily protein [Corynebacterium comes]
MNVTELIQDMASRPIAVAEQLPLLSASQLNAHPGNHPNSIAWLLWHSGREVDVQLSHLSGRPELWTHYRDRFGLGEVGDTLGYGHDHREAGAVVVNDQQLLTDYLRATLEGLSDYAAGLDEEDLSEVIDSSWDPAVTRGVRLVSIIDDAAQHVGQAAYAAGMLTR